jgi:hypothetical protein
MILHFSLFTFNYISMARLTTYAHKKLKKAVTRIDKKMRKTKK